MQVKIGKVKTVREILGLKDGDPNVTAFVMVKDGHHYSFNEVMNAWGVTKHVCVFIDRASKNHPYYTFIGTLAGGDGFNFLPEWLEGTFDQELSDDDPRALWLRHVAAGSKSGPEDIIKRLMGGE